MPRDQKRGKIESRDKKIIEEWKNMSNYRQTMEKPNQVIPTEKSILKWMEQSRLKTEKKPKSTKKKSEQQKNETNIITGNKIGNRQKN